MNQEFIARVASVCYFESAYTLEEIESRLTQAREELAQELNGHQYGFLAMGVSNLISEVWKLMATHKYCALENLTPQRRSLNNIMATVDFLSNSVEYPPRKELIFTNCGSNCIIPGGKQECLNHVDKNSHFAEMGLRMTPENTPRFFTPLTKHQLSSIRAYKMSAPGTRVENIIRISFK